GGVAKPTAKAVSAAQAPITGRRIEGNKAGASLPGWMTPERRCRPSGIRFSGRFDPHTRSAVHQRGSWEIRVHLG
ncbi:hypothetical protein, partial [Streptomyces sp. NPDC047981]|uniref:hypothetical protein n=1 Tax=Streptomyces sp. NPDC047981 TaxID=3154610 RepID=UPI0034280537